jgi:tRNA threonylcarbamoyl adenosine modification protein YeaZ
MKILAFDTSGFNLSVALFSEQKLLTKNIIFESNRQSELLIVEIEKILKQNRLWYQDLNLIAATKGPGSFTGIRISVTVARILKLATGLPLVLLNSCEVIAYKYWLRVQQNKAKKSEAGDIFARDIFARDIFARDIFVLLAATAGDFFYGQFSRKISKKITDKADTKPDNSFITSFSFKCTQYPNPGIVKSNDLLQILPGKNFLLCGSGKKAAAAILQKENIKFQMTEEEDIIEADLVALLAYEKFQKDQERQERQERDINFDPIYLRKPQISERKG